MVNYYSRNISIFFPMGNAVRGQAIPFWKALSKKGWTFLKGMRLLLAPVLRKVANLHWYS